MNKFFEYIGNYTRSKNVCILGFGREGKSTYRILKQYCSPKSICIADLNTSICVTDLTDDTSNEIPENVKLFTGENYQDCLNDFDIVFKSPGIVLKKSAAELDCEISSETQVFFSCFRNQIVGITGTKGKSTVTSLIYHILRESGKDAFIAGNIGIPVFDIAEKITDDSIVVCELSCHQLEYMTVSPHIAVFLNLYEEHLDHYGSIENYYNAKKNIYLHQCSDDILFCNSDLISNNIAPITVSLSDIDSAADTYVNNSIIHTSDNRQYVIPTDKIKLLGVHNHYNIAVALEACSRLGVTTEEFENALCTFNPLAHRLEFVDEINGIRYYDDSISTACETAIEALKSVPNAGTILIGGMDRGIDYTSLVEFLAEFRVNVICMEASGKRIFDIINAADFPHRKRVHYVDHLEEAVKLAAEITPVGSSCVLSPAAASYGIFKNFEERGDVFKKLVFELK